MMPDEPFPRKNGLFLDLHEISMDILPNVDHGTIFSQKYWQTGEQREKNKITTTFQKRTPSVSSFSGFVNLWNVKPLVA